MKLLVETYIIIIYESSIPLCYTDIKISQLFISFDTHKLSITACPEMGADILVGQRGQLTHVIPCFLLNVKIPTCCGVTIITENFKCMCNFST